MEHSNPDTIMMCCDIHEEESVISLRCYIVLTSSQKCPVLKSCYSVYERISETDSTKRCQTLGGWASDLRKNSYTD